MVNELLWECLPAPSATEFSHTYLSRSERLGSSMKEPAVGIIGVGAAGFKPAVRELSTRELMFEGGVARVRGRGDRPPEGGGLVHHYHRGPLGGLEHHRRDGP